jgi:hypothetical protein
MRVEAVVAGTDEPLEGFGEVCDVLVPRIDGSGELHLAQGVQLGPTDRFQLLGSVPSGQRWAYQPGEIVRCTIKVFSGMKEAHWLATGRYTA